MARAICVIMVALTLLLLTTPAKAQDGRLQRARDQVSDSSCSNSDNNTSKKSSDWGSTSDSDGDTCGGNGLILLLAPFVLPRYLFEDETTRNLPFAPHPYAGGYHGYQIMTPAWANAYYEIDTRDIPRKDWAVRVSVENGNDFDGLNRIGAQLKLEHESRFGILTNWIYFHENLSGGRTDETVIGDANITFRFAQNEVASMYTGLGFRVLSDRHLTEYGFNFTYGGDWFPARPFIVSGQIDAGTLGTATVFHARASVGVIWQGVEAFAGFDYLRIGDVNLQGPMAGVRFWF